MILDIPFYKNDEKGVQCMQVAMKAALKYFLGEDYSLEDLDKISGRKGEYYTYTSQIAPVLYDLGLNVRFYSSESLEPYLEGEDYMKKHFGKHAEKILERTDMPVVINSIKKLSNYDIFEKRKIFVEDIVNFISKGYIVMALIDYNKISYKNNLYQGHFVIVTGFDEENIYYHESGPNNPLPNKKVKKEIFMEAMDAQGTDGDCVVVFGKR